jgi:hypothetical protein
MVSDKRLFRKNEVCEGDLQYDLISYKKTINTGEGSLVD